jgi:hypothetical protein
MLSANRMVLLVEGTVARPLPNIHGLPPLTFAR